MHTEVNEKPLLAIVASVQLPTVSDEEFEASLTELRELAKTLGYRVVRTFTQKRGGFDRTAYLGTGKLDEIKLFVERGLEEAQSHLPPKDRDPSFMEIDAVLIDHEISPSQARNLELAVGCEVMDRTMVILEIFHRNARSRAARAQVEIARLGYMAPRLREAAKLAGPQGRQRSGTGGRGAGESHTELDRRKVRDRIAELQREIVAMELERKTQRARRLERQGQGLGGVSLVGYTNAGKSTLMRALTGSDVLVENKLFATLDTTVRAIHPETVPRILVSDTVGFIKNLPHGLVASFKSTLEEALDAALLLHVIDASDPGFERQLEVTDEVLREIGADEVPRLRVFNKIDHVGDEEARAARTLELQQRYPGCVITSALNPGMVATLRDTIVSFFRQELVDDEILLPWAKQQLRGEIYRYCEVLEERTEDDGSRFRVRGEPEKLRELHETLNPGSRGREKEYWEV
ncbi:GTPase HflX [Paludibacterium paludis]|uniref:GTPase HflX n=1 Tax=Paludibacterium paludis TaxID=1225769 RepID=A0A918UB54_9NEIS|nr:GTPase HflX [Paludibacterium paludis]GGY20125.1 GTPase HflX [Paludibacterium paludis]